MAVECAGRQPELALETGGVRHRAACWSPLYTPISASHWASVFISYNREPVQAPCHSYRPSFLQNFPRGDDSTFRGNALTHILLPFVSPPVQGPEGRGNVSHPSHLHPSTSVADSRQDPAVLLITCKTHRFQTSQESITQE